MDDERAVQRAATEDEATAGAPTELSWPLVERRQRREPPPEGIERRSTDIAPPPPDVREVTLDAPPLAPFRWVALGLAAVQAADEVRDGQPAYWIGLAVLTAYVVILTIRPIPYRATRRAMALVVLELAIQLVVIATTGGWTSPFAYALIPTTVLAGFVAGLGFSVTLTASAIGVLLAEAGIAATLDDRGTITAVWSTMLLVVAVTAGLSRRAFEANARTRALALDRMSRLAEANALLFSLQRVAQTLPASLDLDDVLDSSLARVRSLIAADVVTVLLYNEADGTYEPVRGRGSHEGHPVLPDELPPPLRRAMTANRAVAVTDLAVEGPGVADEAVEGIYAGLRARGALVGLIAIESRTAGRLGAQQAEVLTGITEPLGVAVDNARLFRRIRSVGADEERARIARDLHDRVGSSLALLGFEVDGLIARCERGEQPHAQLVELRQQITTAIGGVREMLYDLRTEVSETDDLVAVLTHFLERVEQRSALHVDLSITATERLPVLLERELWHIAREAITNAERHSGTSTLHVRWTCDGTAATLEVADQGRGFERGTARADSYGLVGMRERAAGIGAQLLIDSHPGRGTTVRCSLAPIGGWP